jgi:hypothetical protein
MYQTIQYVSPVPATPDYSPVQHEQLQCVNRTPWLQLATYYRSTSEKSTANSAGFSAAPMSQPYTGTLQPFFNTSQHHWPKQSIGTRPLGADPSETRTDGRATTQSKILSQIIVLQPLKHQTTSPMAPDQRPQSSLHQLTGVSKPLTVNFTKELLMTWRQCLI